MTQYHLLDDSGDTGLNESPSSSRYLVLAMVQLLQHEPLPELARLRQALHLASTFEFKFYKTSHRQREAFFKAIVPVCFEVRAAVIDKSSLPPQYKSMSGQTLTVEFITRLALRATEQEIAEDTLFIDGATPAFCRALRIQLSAACRESGRVRPFKKIAGAQSDREDGLQIADMVAGAIHRHFAQTTEGYLATFASRVVDLMEVPARSNKTPPAILKEEDNLSWLPYRRGRVNQTNWFIAW